MALTATVYKADLQVSDVDRGYYETHRLTLARHPSETEERLMVRLVAFALFATERLQFTRGLSSDEEPDLWDIDYDGTVLHWIELGLPDERRIRRACQRSRRVTVIAYGGRGTSVWWNQLQPMASRFAGLEVLVLPKEATDSLVKMAARNMDLTATIQDGQLWLAGPEGTTEIIPQRLWPEA